MHSALDSRKQLIIDTARGGKTPFAVYGKGRDVRLIPLDEDIDRDALARDKANGLRYCGVLGEIDGRPRVALEPDAGCLELEAVRYAAASLLKEKFGDSLSWLDRLWALSDTRTEMPC